MTTALLALADIHPTLTQILEGTREGRVKWSAANNRAVADFASAKLNLEPADGTRGPAFRLSLDISISGAVIWATPTEPSDEVNATLQELHQLGIRNAVNAVLKDIERDLTMAIAELNARS